MKICSVVPVWGRFKIAELVIRAMLYARLANQLDLTVIVVGSEGEESRKLTQLDSSIEYVEYNNSDPLGMKIDAGVSRARELNADVVGAVGSDDMITEPYFTFVSQQITNGQQVTGLLDCCLYDTQLDQFWRWNGYTVKHFERYPSGMRCRYGEPSGAGRFLSRELLDKVDWKSYSPTIKKEDGAWVDDDPTNWELIRHNTRLKHRSIVRCFVAGCNYFNIKSGNEKNSMSAFKTYFALDNVTVEARSVYNWWIEELDKRVPVKVFG